MASVKKESKLSEQLTVGRTKEGIVLGYSTDFSLKEPTPFNQTNRVLKTMDLTKKFTIDEKEKDGLNKQGYQLIKKFTEEGVSEENRDKVLEIMMQAGGKVLIDHGGFCSSLATVIEEYFPGAAPLIIDVSSLFSLGAKAKDVFIEGPNIFDLLLTMVDQALTNNNKLGKAGVKCRYGDVVPSSIYQYVQWFIDEHMANKETDPEEKDIQCLFDTISLDDILTPIVHYYVPTVVKL